MPSLFDETVSEKEMMFELLAGIVEIMTTGFGEAINGISITSGAEMELLNACSQVIIENLHASLSALIADV